MAKIWSANRQIINLGGIALDGYQIHETGEFRASMTGASTLCGYSKNWLGRVTTKASQTLKALQQRGFTGLPLMVSLPAVKGGGHSAKTISLDDLNILIDYAADEGNARAAAVQKALSRVALEDIFRQSFGQQAMDIDQRRQLFYKAYANSLTVEDWLKMDAEDINALVLPGDELYHPAHKDWEFKY